MDKGLEEEDKMVEKLFLLSGRDAVERVNKKVFTLLWAITLISTILYWVYLYMSGSLNIATISESLIVVVGISALEVIGLINGWYGVGIRAGMANAILRKVSRDMVFENTEWTVTMKDGDNKKRYAAMNQDELKLFHLSLAIGLIKASPLLSKSDLNAVVDSGSKEDVVEALRASPVIIDINNLAARLAKLKTG